MESSADIVSSIVTRRCQVVERLLQTNEGQELARLDAAFTAMTGEPPPPLVNATTNSPTRSNAKMPASERSRAGAEPSKPRTRRGSVRKQIHEIIEETPAKWTYDTIAAEMRRRGQDTLGSKNDSRSSLRTAVWNLVHAGDAVRGESGVFWASKFDGELGDPPLGEDHALQGVPDRAEE